MRQQIQTYFSRNSANKVDFARTLYVIYGGPNDFIFNNTLLPPTIIGSLLNGALDLLAFGAKNILIFNIPPVQKMPYSRPFNDPLLFTELGIYSNLFLTAEVKQIQTLYPSASLYVFDLNSFLSLLLNKTTTYFTDVVDNCWTVYNITTVEKLCPNQEKYVFIDEFHLTTRAQGLLAAAVRPFLDSAYEVNNGNCYIKAVQNL